MTEVGVVVPAYKPDPELLRSYVASLAAQLDARIRIELDDPDPGVARALTECQAAVRTHPGRRGKGAAITTGFEALDTDVLAFVDADGSTPASSVADVIRPVVEGAVDLAVGSRRHPESWVKSHQTYARRYLGDGFAWIARQVLRPELYDYQCGAKAITREGWSDVRSHIYEPGFAWDIELIAIASANNLEIREVPVTWVDRPGSTVAPVRTAVELGLSLFRARHRARRLTGSNLHELVSRDESALIDRSMAQYREDD